MTTTPDDAVLTWTVLIAKAAALGVLDSERPATERTGFRSRPPAPNTQTGSNPVAVTEARGWLLDCGFDEDTLDELCDRQIVGMVAWEYEGGWAGYLDAIEPLLGAPESPTGPTAGAETISTSSEAGTR